MKLRLKDVRLAFADLFEATQVNGQGNFKYRCVLLLPKDHPQLKEVRNAIAEVAKEKWPAKHANILEVMKTDKKTCLNDGNDKEYDGYEDCFFISASSDARPLVIDRDRTPLVAADGRPYSGCYVNASIDLWAQYNKYGKRINAQLGGVQFLRDGDAFSASRPASVEEFEDLSEGSDADNKESPSANDNDDDI